MAIEKYADTPTLFKNAKAFEVWLQQHHASSQCLWLQIAKRHALDASVTSLEAVEIALCWGWIDGQKKALDAHYFLQRFTPRRARSVWSKVNVEKVAALIQQGRMQAPGLAQVEAAKTDGRWARAYDGARTSTVPEDLIAALDAAPIAKAFFAEISATAPAKGQASKRRRKWRLNQRGPCEPIPCPCRTRRRFQKGAGRCCAQIRIDPGGCKKGAQGHSGGH